MDNDPKHTAKPVIKWLKDNKVNVLEQASQSPELNPIENVKVVYKHDSVHQFCQEEWDTIPANHCEKLVEGYSKTFDQSQTV